MLKVFGNEIPITFLNVQCPVLVSKFLPELTYKSLLSYFNGLLIHNII